VRSPRSWAAPYVVRAEYDVEKNPSPTGDAPSDNRLLIAKMQNNARPAGMTVDQLREAVDMLPSRNPNVK
jgi:hypothetical protein